MRKFLFFAIMAIVIAGCSTEPGSVVKVADISISPPSVLLTPGSTVQLTATVTPSDAANKNVMWTSSSEACAMVNSTGMVMIPATATAGTVSITATAADGSGVKATCTVTVALSKTVSVGAQSGTMTAGVANTVTFPVSTANIANGNYTAPVANLPTGVSLLGSVTINNNSGTLTLSGNTSTTAGTYSTLRVTIDNTQSEDFTLTISPTKTVSAGAQNGSMIAGTAGTVTFPVGTANITDGNYTATVANLPTGVSVQGQVTINNSSGTLTLAGNTSTTAGTYSTLRLTIDNTQSEDFTLTISPTKTVSVGTQSGTMIAGTASTVTFPVSTANISNGYYTATVANLPTGVSVQGQVALNNNSGTLTLSGNTSTTAGSYSTLRLTIDNTQSEDFTLIVFDGGNGTPDNPFKVYNVATLQKVGSGTDGWTRAKHYIQTADIDLSSVSNWTPNSLSGSYNGDGFTISNLNSVGQNHQGLFSTIEASGVVRNLRLTNVYISATNGWFYAGGVAGNNYGTIEYCYVNTRAGNTSSIVGQNAGGVTGYNHNTGIVRNCLVTGGRIGGTGSGSGGVTGANGGIVENCYTTVDVTGRTAGGILSGTVGTGTVQYCYATGNIQTNYVQYQTTPAGGVAGVNLYGTIQNCVALNKYVRAWDGILYNTAGRIAGNSGGSYHNNYARNTMIVQVYGNNVYIIPNANGMHGADVTAANYHGANSSTWWGNTTSGPGFPSSAWDFRTNGLPTLKGFPSLTQNPTVTP